MSKIDEVSGWVHFGPLRFLEDVLDRKQIEMQILNGCCDNERMNENNFVDHCEIIIEEDEKTVVDENEFAEKQQQNRRMRACDMQTKEEDENVHFFKSLLPYFKTMDMTSKLRIRIEIQKMLLEELLPESKTDTDCDNLKSKKNSTKASIPTRTSTRVVKKNRKYFRK